MPASCPATGQVPVARDARGHCVWISAFAGTEPISRTASAYWPACALLLGFSWIELVYPNAAAPLHLAWFAIGYSLLTFAGMALFGRDTWLRHGEVFTVVFGLFARFAPTAVRAGPPRLLLRPFGAGLLDSARSSTSMMAFVLLLLATVLFDGPQRHPGWIGTRKRACRAALPLFGEPPPWWSGPPGWSRSGSC